VQHICKESALAGGDGKEHGMFPKYRSTEDWEFWLGIAGRFSTAVFAAVPKPLCIYRRVEGGLNSNAMRSFNIRHPIIENRSLYGTSGLNRFLLYRRIVAFNHYDTAIALREEGSLAYFSFILKSLAMWPFPNKLLSMERYKTSAVMFMQHLGWWPSPFRQIAGPR
jgi:hypothetical protein